MTLIAALVTFVGTALFTTWASGRQFRERKALREEAELLAALPDGLESKNSLRKHLNDAVNKYLQANTPAKARRRRRNFGFALVTVSFLVLIAMWVLMNMVGEFGRPGSPWWVRVVFLLGVALNGAGSALVGWNWRSARPSPT